MKRTENSQLLKMSNTCFKEQKSYMSSDAMKEQTNTNKKHYILWIIISSRIGEHLQIDEHAFSIRKQIHFDWLG